MSKKIAKNCLLITLLFMMIVSGIIAPIKYVNFKAEAAWWNWTKPKSLESEELDVNKKEENECPTCFVAVEGLKIWNLLSAPIDTVLSYIPGILVVIIKWILILLARILQSVLSPVPGSFFFGLNRFMDPKGLIYWIWSSSLYYANIMITLFLIWIAINIILEKKEYTSYQSLIKLLVVALLVNFSLVICTLFVDLSNYLAVLFMSGVSMSAFSCLYTCVLFKVTNMFNCMANNMIFSQTIANSIALMIGIIFVGQILGLIFFVLTRMVYLWFLVGISPIAFVLSAIPETRGIYKQWMGMFQANLVKLPILAFATYFILNIMIFIANSMMTDTSFNSNVLAKTVGVVFVLIILSQGLLLVAQNLGVNQITKMSSTVSSWAKKGWDAARRPATSWGVKKLFDSKGMKSAVEKGQTSKNYLLAGFANKVADRMTREQKYTQDEINKWKENKNVGVLEETVRKNANPVLGDRTKFLQAMQALSELESEGDYKDKHNILSNQKNMAIVKELIDDDTYGETAAGKFMKKRYTWLKAGPDTTKKEHINEYKSQARAALGVGASEEAVKEMAKKIMYDAPYQNIGNPTNPDDVNNQVYKKMIGELYERATKTDKSALNNWFYEFQRLYDASKGNTNPLHFVQIFKDFQRTISAQKMRQIFDTYIGSGQREKFWANIARMAIVADKINRGVPLTHGTIGEEMEAVSPAEIQLNSPTGGAKQALINLAGNPRDSWMADTGGNKASFLKSLIANQFINP